MGIVKDLLELSETKSTGTIGAIYNVLKGIIVIYVVLFLLWAILSVFGLADILVYMPAHFFFGSFKYLDFYLMYGIPVICLYSFIFFLVAMLICRLFVKPAPSGEKWSTKPLANSKDEPEKKIGFMEWRSEIRFIFAIILTPVAFCLAIYASWNYVMPDFKMVLAGEYLTIEAESDRFWTDKIRSGRRRSFGYNYKITIPSHLDPDSKQDARSFVNDLFDSMELHLSYPLYKELNALNSRKSNNFVFMPDGKVKMQIPEREYVIIQFHYLPHTECLLGYTVMQ